MAGSTEMLAAFRELTTTKQLERSDLLELLRDGIQAALVRKFGPNVRFELIDAVHMMPAQAPAALLALLQDFLGGEAQSGTRQRAG